MGTLGRAARAQGKRATPRSRGAETTSATCCKRGSTGALWEVHWRPLLKVTAPGGPPPWSLSWVSPTDSLSCGQGWMPGAHTESDKSPPGCMRTGPHDSHVREELLLLFCEWGTEHQRDTVTSSHKTSSGWPSSEPGLPPQSGSSYSPRWHQGRPEQSQGPSTDSLEPRVLQGLAKGTDSTMKAARDHPVGWRAFVPIS